ncbi:MAG: hypothetical protein JST00_14915 [Deltaproteobacteria bacterium]|nr:hypothetical protein [Deltaproteobacteria bacterium]
MNAITRALVDVTPGGITPWGARSARVLVQEADVRAARAIDAITTTADPRSAVASACRAVGTLFLVGAMSGWHEAEVEAWLHGAYADLTALARRDRALLERDTPRAWAEVDGRALELGSSEHPMMTRQRVLSGVRALAAGRTERIGSLARAGLLVRRVPFGMSTYWSPCATDRADIESRVLSLFAADFLRRPADYAQPLVLCDTCRAPVLDVQHDVTRCAALVRVTDMPTSGVRESD